MLIHIRIALIILICCFLVACGNVKDLKFSKDNQEEIFEKIKKSKDLTGEETGLLMAALMRMGFSKESLEGKTVGQVIKEQKAIMVQTEAKEKEAKRLAEEAKKKEEEVAAKLSQYITIAPFKKDYHKAKIYNGEYQDTINISFAFENKGTKDIKAFKGTAIFKDLFGVEIYTSNLMNDGGIKAGQKKNWTGSIKYNQFESGQQKLRDTDLENMKFEWKPSAIIFTDESKIGLETTDE